MINRGTWEDWAPWFGNRAGEIRTAVSFSTRLPLPAFARAAEATIAQAIWALPLAGLLVGGAWRHRLCHRAPARRAGVAGGGARHRRDAGADRLPA